MQLQASGQNRSEILLIEPGFVATSFANINDPEKDLRTGDSFSQHKIVPIPPEEMAEAVCALLKNTGVRNTTLTPF